MPKYDAEYYIEKFSAIPEEEWITGQMRDDKGRKCALGHCEVNEQPELRKLFLNRFGLYPSEINDRTQVGLFEQSTPRARILAALSQIRTTEKEDGR